MKASIKVVVALKLNAITMKSLLLITLLCGVTSLCSGEELDQNVTNDAVVSLVSRQKRAYGIETGMSPTVPTVSVDLWTLIRFAVKQQLLELGGKLIGPTDPVKPPITSPVFPPGRTFPSNFLNLTTLGNRNYFFSKRQKLSWMEASAFCRMYGMDLASVESKEEDDLIEKEVERLGLHVNYVWFSGNKIGRASYHWINGQPFVFDNWNPGQPDNFPNDHCAMTWYGKWHDVACETSTFFICEEPDTISIGK